MPVSMHTAGHWAPDVSWRAGQCHAVVGEGHRSSGLSTRDTYCRW
ncbi:f-box domain-containing protein, partial [Colletotrichum scovillei]